MRCSCRWLSKSARRVDERRGHHWRVAATECCCHSALHSPPVAAAAEGRRLLRAPRAAIGIAGPEQAAAMPSASSSSAPSERHTSRIESSRELLLQRREEERRERRGTVTPDAARASSYPAHQAGQTASTGQQRTLTVHATRSFTHCSRAAAVRRAAVPWPVRPLLPAPHSAPFFPLTSHKYTSTTLTRVAALGLDCSWLLRRRPLRTHSLLDSSGFGASSVASASNMKLRV